MRLKQSEINNVVNQENFAIEKVLLRLKYSIEKFNQNLPDDAVYHKKKKKPRKFFD